MQFHSIQFGIFLVCVFCLYWMLQRSLRLQNLFVLVASYLFYSCWDWRFLGLIVLSSAVDYSCGLLIGRTERDDVRKAMLFTSLIVNLGLLGVFKYYNFFVDSLVDLMATVGFSVEPSRVALILPVGISFYTFQTLSYTIDIYRRELPPTRDITAFFAFVGFFPQLVAGPIERARHLLPQFEEHRTFNYDKAVDGMRQMLWGLFKKVVVADSCAWHVDFIFEHYGELGGSTLLLGAVLFAFQIYGDFSGYSDVAVGLGKLLGFRLSRNFNSPYFSRTISEFWHRWHISLSTWFRDYLYIPLGGSRCKRALQVRNVMLTFIVSGIWHGANWTFAVWGTVHGLYYVLEVPLKASLSSIGRDSRLWRILQVLCTFTMVTLAWIPFRAPTLGVAIDYLQRLFSAASLTVPDRGGACLTLGVAAIGFERLRTGEHPLGFDSLHIVPRWLIYLVLALSVVAGMGNSTEFIYFQF